METGRVVRFDEVRGYGFVAPESGGEDVFLHANDLEMDKRLIMPGVQVEFEVEDGGRGLKASHVRLVHGGSGQPAGGMRSGQRSEDDEGLCDVLSRRELTDEVTEALLDAVPNLTGEQIKRVRDRMVTLAQSHGWLES